MKASEETKDFTYLCGGEFDESLIKLSITSETLVPMEVTKILGIEPTKFHSMGDLSKNKKRIMNYGLWLLESPWVANISIEDNLKKFMDKLPKNPDIWNTLHASYDCELTLVLRMRTSNRSGTIPISVIHELAARNLKLEIDIYHDNEPELYSKQNQA